MGKNLSAWVSGEREAKALQIAKERFGTNTSEMMKAALDAFLAGQPQEFSGLAPTILEDLCQQLVGYQSGPFREALRKHGLGDAQPRLLTGLLIGLLRYLQRREHIEPTRRDIDPPIMVGIDELVGALREEPRSSVRLAADLVLAFPEGEPYSAVAEDALHAITPPTAGPAASHPTRRRRAVVPGSPARRDAAGPDQAANQGTG